MNPVTNFGKPYAELHRVAPSGWLVWKKYSANNFNNPTAKADRALYDKMGWWAEIFRDKITGKNGKVFYIENAGTKKEKITEIKNMPQSGWIVPTKKGWFIPHILMPFKTGKKEEAIEALKNLKQPKEQVSYFYRLDSYDDIERFVGRDFGPNLDDHGRFDVDANRLPEDSGHDGVGSRSAHGIKCKHKFVCENCGQTQGRR